MPLSLARQEPSLLELLLAVCPGLCPVSLVFQASSQYLYVVPFLSLFLFCLHPVDSYLLFPDSLGKAGLSLRFLSFLLCVLHCSWPRVVYIFVHMSVFLYCQGLSTMPGRSWMLIC